MGLLAGLEGAWLIPALLGAPTARGAVGGVRRIPDGALGLLEEKPLSPSSLKTPTTCTRSLAWLCRLLDG